MRTRIDSLSTHWTYRLRSVAKASLSRELNWLATCSALLVATLIFAPTARGQGLVYEDADIVFVNGVGNLAAADGNPDPFAIFNDDFSNPEDDGVWDIRGAEDPNTNTSDNLGSRPAGSTGQQSVFASGGRGDGENSPELVQTISGLSSNTNYDIYAVYWSAVNADWGVRAGFSADPGGNQYFNRTGDDAGSTSAIAGITASSAFWTTQPGTNSDAGIFAEGNRTMYLGKVGTQSSDGSGSLGVYIDDLSTEEEGLGDVFRTWYEGLAYVETGNDVVVRATIDRDTGALSLINNTPASFDVASYSITSAAGSLDATQWSSIAPGNNGQDSDAWVRSSETSTELTESEDPANDGFSLSGTFSLGNVWQQSPFEDTQITLTLTDSTEVVLVPEFEGTTFSDAFEIGDINTDGSIDLGDYATLVANYHAPVDTEVNDTLLELHNLGDLNGDEAVNYADLVQFRELFAEANPGAVLELANVPEPSTLLLSSCGLLALAAFRRRRLPALAQVCVAMVAMFVLSTSSAMAQITYIDASTSNTTNADGSLFEPTADVNAADDLWRERSPFGNGGVIYAADETIAAEDAVRLATTITVPAPGAYNVYSYFWSANNSDWHIRAGTENIEGDLTAFGRLTDVAPAAVAGDFAGSAPLLTEGNRDLYQASLGIVSTETTSITVFVDDFDSEGGDGQRAWYDGLGFQEAITLTLEVDRSNGEIKIQNLEDVALSLDYYEIRSESSLNPTGWSSLDEQENDAFGIGWDVLGGSSSSFLAEARSPVEGSVELAAGTGEFDLGAGFSLGGEEDLVFFYALDNGNLQPGIVSYINDPPVGTPGDFDDDLDVDGADFLSWQRGEATGGATPANLTLWQDNYGTPAPASGVTAVPEPSSCALALLSILALGGLNRTNTKDRS